MVVFPLLQFYLKEALAGLVAILLGLVLRVSAFLLLRRNSLYAIDDYVSMSYPNIFLVILLASLLEVDELLYVSSCFRERGLVTASRKAPRDLRRALQRIVGALFGGRASPVSRPANRPSGSLSATRA